MIVLTSPYDTQFGQLLTESYARIVGASLLPEGQLDDPARWLYEEAPFGLLAHAAETDTPFVYANLTSQRHFEYSWDEFIGLPSRLSAEAPNREERQELMAAVMSQGYADNYRGRRIAKSGRRFWIEGTTVWNLVDPDGILHGQAALIRRYSDV